MEYKYDAFISYRHAEKDTMIASEIQKSLERFKIPKALQKQTGKERFNRIFRDVEELPISSNLTEDLTEALRLSQFLIVICSYRTSESDWVKREIETFLELHDYNKQLILTVLVEGEPDEVIPEELRHDNIIHYLADGTFYCKDEVVEPLAANYRMPIAKARKTELPRLAASMLGCNYDDIIRRRKAFRRRRLLIETVLISVAAIGLLSYIGWTLVKIQDNLRNAQMNQSRYLSTESQKLLDGGDRISALQLAVSALENTDGSSRPVTSEAVYALANALGAYQTWGSSVSSPVWRYEVSSTIIKYECDYSSKNVAVLESSGVLHIWDRKEHKESVLGDEDNHIYDFIFDKYDNLIVIGQGYTALYETNSLQERWRFENNGFSKTREVNILYSSAKEIVGVNANSSFFLLNAVDGSVYLALETSNIKFFKDIHEKTGEFFSLTRFLVNNDFSEVILIGADSDTSYSMYSYDIKKDKWQCLISNSGDFLQADFDDDGNIMVLRHSKEDPDAKKYAGMDELYDSSVIMELISDKGKSAWKNELSSTMRIIDRNVISLQYKTKDEETIPVVVAVFANRCVVADKKTGKTIKSFDLPGSAISTGLSKSIDGMIRVNLVLQNGKAVWLPLNAKIKYISSQKYFPDGSLRMKSFKDGDMLSYLVEDSTEKVVTEFDGRYSDSKFMGIEGTEEMSDLEFVSVSPSGNFLIAFSNDKTITGIDLKNRKVLWTTKGPGIGLEAFDAYSSDEKYFYVQKETNANDPKQSLVRLDLSNGKFEDLNNEFAFNSRLITEGYGGKLYSINDETAQNKELTLYSYDIATNTAKKMSLDISNLRVFHYLNVLSISPDGKKVFFYVRTEGKTQNKVLRLMIDGETGKFTTSECGYCKLTAWNEKGSLFAEFYDEGTISVCSADGKEKYKIDTEQRTPNGMQFFENKLYVLYNNDQLCSYNSIGNQLMSINLNHSALKNGDKVRFEFLRNYLFVSTEEYTDIINLSDKKSIGSFRGFLCLHNKKEAEKSLSSLVLVSKTFLNGNKIPRIGCFEYKTVPKMIDQAKEYLKQNGGKMSEEFKRKYGIE